MKCIKEKCKYYKENDYRASYFDCTVSMGLNTFKKDSDIDCIIDEVIEDIKFRYDYLSSYKIGLEEDAKEDVKLTK